MRASRRRRYGFALIVAAIALLSVACASEVSEGQGTLPTDTHANLLPDVDFVGYLYFHPVIPASVDIRRFLPSGGADILPLDITESAEVSRATILTSTDGELGGSLEFVRAEDAQRVYDLYQRYPVEAAIWARLDSSTLDVVRGNSLWAESVREKLELGNTVSIGEKTPEAWALLTNLPVSEDDPPIAAGLISPDDSLIEDIQSNVGVDLSELDIAFGNIGAQRLAFAIYGDEPIDITQEIDFRFLDLQDVGMVIVSKTDYPGFALSFLVSTIAGRIGMETIELGSTNARYLETEHARLILKNKGSLIYAALAGDRLQAEQLMLRALAD